MTKFMLEFDILTENKLKLIANKLNISPTKFLKQTSEYEIKRINPENIKIVI